MTDDERKWFEDHVERRLDDLEKTCQDVKARLGGMVTWQSLGTVALILVGVTTLLVSLLGGGR